MKLNFKKTLLISLVYFVVMLINLTQPEFSYAASCPAGARDFGNRTICLQSCTTSCSGPDSRCCASAAINAGGAVTSDVFDKLNPLVQENSDPTLAKELSTPGGIVSRFLGSFAFPIAGLILFVMLVWGGFEMMAGSATKKSVDAGKQRVTAALIGFLLLFASFWIARIMEMMFGIKIL